MNTQSTHPVTLFTGQWADLPFVPWPLSAGAGTRICH